MFHITNCIIIIWAASLPHSQATVCSYTSQQSYQTRCQDLLSWFRCTKTREITRYRCCAGWSGHVASNCSTPLCFGVPTCPNGGNCTGPDYCNDCDRGYYSPGCEQCTTIANCLQVSCSNAFDQTCDQCDGDYGPSYGSAYKKSDDHTRCIKQCSWRTNSNACYPGTCNDGRCTCSTGFFGEDCRTMESSQAPILSDYRAALDLGNTTLAFIEAQNTTTNVFTNVRNFTSIRIDLEGFYHPSGLPDPSVGGHPYVHSASLGVVSASVEFIVTGVQTGVEYHSGPEACSASINGAQFSQDRPTVGLLECGHTFTVNHTAWTPASGDILWCAARLASGGNLKLYDRDNFSNVITRYYDGREAFDLSTFTFDFDDPYHCVDVSSGCQFTMLNSGSDVTPQALIRVTWQGWNDDGSGIKEYVLQVRQLSGTRGNEMTEIFDSPAVYDGVTSSGQTVTLPHVGVYSVILTVTDNAGNSRLSRRFVFFDDDPDDVTIQSDSPLRVLSATPETGYEWLASLDPSGGPTSVVLDWTNHFINLPHHNQGLLKPVGSYRNGTVRREYDQYFGQRGRAAIPNLLGVTQFRVRYDIDNSGGRTIVNVSDDNSDNWSNETTNTRATYNLTLVDGDSIRFWVEARDIAGHYARDSALVHVDSSPPVIEEVKVVPGLSGISVECSTYDIHSGVHTTEWRLFDNHTGTEVEYGRKTETAVKRGIDSDDCRPDGCACVPTGECYTIDYKQTFPIDGPGSDYYLTLSVTNRAGLVTTKTIQVHLAVTQDNVERVAESLVSLTNDTSAFDDEAVASTADLLESIANIGDTSPEVTASVVKAVSNLLEVDAGRFGDSDNAANASSRIVQALERQISNVLAAGKNVSQVTSSVAVVARNLHPSSLVGGVGFAAVAGNSENDSFADSDFNVYRGSEGEVSTDQVEASIKLPEEILKEFPSDSNVPISFIMYENSNLFRSQQTGDSLANDSTSFVGSQIVSVDVLNVSITNLPPEQPIIYTFRLKQVPNQNETCVFWDFSLRDGIGDWSISGCRLNSSIDGRVVCHCNHATNFAVLVNIHEERNASFALDVVSKIGCAVSIVALGVTIFLYCAIRPLRKKTTNRILISFCVSLLCLYLVFLAGVEQTSFRVGCTIAAVLLHYFALTSMAWMGVEATNMYLKFVKVLNADVEHFMVKASIVAWGFPMLIIAVILAVDYTVYENENSCFLKPGAAFYYGQLLIIGLVLLFNAVVFVFVLRRVTCNASKIRSASAESKRSKVARRLQNLACISVLLGLTWAFGLLSVLESASFVFQVIFSVLNSLQGFFVFLLFVVRQDKVREYVSGLVRGKRAKYSASSASGTCKLTLSTNQSGSSALEPSYRSVSDGTDKTGSGSAGTKQHTQTSF